jgi:hypothetical protein
MELPTDHYQQPVVEAEYKGAEVSIYRGNPLLEALPPPVPEEEVLARLAQKPAYDAAERKLPSHVRIHLLQNLHRIFQPLARHQDLDQNLSLLMCGTYLNRNPMAPHYSAAMKERVARMDASLVKPVSSLRSGLLTGMSGTGKSFSLDRILSFTPQVIRHTEYEGKPFVHDQVTWLKLECPCDASPRALCLAFFQKMDWLLGTKYLQNYESSHQSTSTMVPALGRVALYHSLGLLIIDEIQHLCGPEGPAGPVKPTIAPSVRNKLLNFIVQVVNTLGVPVLLVGNSNALDFMTSAMRLARRSTDLLHPHWSRFKGDAEWKLFTNALWKYQYLKQETKLTDDLRRELYRQTQGLPDYVVKLYEGVQQFLINEADDELVTPDVLVRVAKEKLSPNAALLGALRDANYDELRRIPDIHPIDIFGPGSPEAVKGWPKKLSKDNRAWEAFKLEQQQAQESQVELPGVTPPKKDDDQEGDEGARKAA